MRFNVESIVANFSDGREFSNYLISADWNTSDINRHGVGFNALVENQTNIRRFSANGQYAYHFPIGDSTSLSVGFQAGYLAYTIQERNLIFYNDLVLGTSNEDFKSFQRGTFVTGGGFNFQNHSVKHSLLPVSWLGVAYHLSLETDDQAVLFNPYLFINGGVRLTTGIYSTATEFEQKIRFHPNFAFYLFENVKRLDVGIFISDNLPNLSIGIGGWIRNLLDDNQFIYGNFAVGIGRLKFNYGLNLPLKENLGEINQLLAHQFGVQFIFDAVSRVSRTKQLGFSKKAAKSISTRKPKSKKIVELVDPTYYNKLKRR